MNEFKKSIYSIHSSENANSTFKGKIRVGNKFESIKVTINHLQKKNKEWSNQAVELTCQKDEDLPVEVGIPEQIFKNSPIKIFSVDRNYCLTFFSKTVIDLLEVLLKEKPVIGKSFFTSEIQKAEWKNYFDIIFSGEKIFLEKNYKNGEEEFYDLLCLSPLKNDNHDIERCIVYVNDILQFKKEEVHGYQNRKKYQHLFENNFLGIGVVDKNNILTQANDSFCNLLGIENKNLEKVRAFDFVSGDELKLFTQKIKEIYRNEVRYFTNELKFKNIKGIVKYVQISLNGLYKNDEFGGCLITVMDISNQKEIQIKEQELKELKSKEKINLQHQLLLQQDLDSRTRELATNQMLITQKNNFIKELSRKLEQAVNKSENFVKPEIRKIINSIKRQNVFDDDWEKLKIHFVKMHPSFFKKIINKSPKISEKDLRHCAYIKLGFSAKETSDLLGTLPRSIEQARFRIKKKLNLPIDQKLKDFLRNI
ncbi:MAG: PAS domain-containing protein [Saprospiraceae bacterium]